MPFVRNPFKRQDENLRPAATNSSPERAGSFSSRSFDTSEKDAAEYKLSEINDSGVCLPPSPVEKKSFWGHTNSSRSTTSSNHRNLVNENEQFSISRESFDSYRRSFDISGRSPVIRPAEYAQRSSLDSRTFTSPSRPSTTRPAPVPIVPPAMKEEEVFEDVGLDDTKPVQAKKRGLFARLTEPNADASHVGVDARPSSSHDKPGWHPFGGRKRGQSGQGAELGSYPNSERASTPRPVAT